MEYGNFVHEDRVITERFIGNMRNAINYVFNGLIIKKRILQICRMENYDEEIRDALKSEDYPFSFETLRARLLSSKCKRNLPKDSEPYVVLKENDFGSKHTKLYGRIEFVVWSCLLIDFFKSLNKYGLLPKWKQVKANNYFLDLYLK